MDKRSHRRTNSRNPRPIESVSRIGGEEKLSSARTMKGMNHESKVAMIDHAEAVCLFLHFDHKSKNSHEKPRFFFPPICVTLLSDLRIRV